MVDNGEFPISLLDLELGGRRLDAQDVVVCSIDHHGGGRREGLLVKAVTQRSLSFGELADGGEIED